jgi:acyl-CoA thioesterase FadM
LRFEEEVEIHLLVSEVRSRSIRYQFIFRQPATGAEFARGTIAAVCATVDKTTGKLVPVSIPDAIRAKITPAPQEMLPPKASFSSSSS